MHVSSLLSKVAGVYSSPLLPKEYARLFTTTVGAADVRGTVVGVRRDSNGVELTVKPHRGFTKNFVPGQYVGVGLRIQGVWKWRSYSLTNTPTSHGKNIVFYIRRNGEGAVSNFVIDNVAVGDNLRLSSPEGQFILPSPPPSKILFITAGSGITPVMSMVRSLFDSHSISRGKPTLNDIYTGDVVHIHSERNIDNFLFHNELMQLEANNRNYRITVVDTAVTSRVNFATDLDVMVPDWQERHAWACGSNQMLRSVQDVYDFHQKTQLLQVEKFSLDRSFATDQGGSVTLGRQDQSFECNAGESILEAAEKNGSTLPAGCRIGICHTCMLSLDEGKAVDLETGHICEPGQKIRTCSTTPLGEVKLDV